MDATTPQIITAAASVFTQVVAISGLAFTILKTRSDVLRAEKEKRNDVERTHKERSEEIERERRTKQATKRAEVAGDALITTLDLLNTLHEVAAPTPLAWEAPGEESAKGVLSHFARRVQTVNASLSEFRKAWPRAETHLPMEAAVVLAEIAQAANTIRWSQSNLAEVPAGLDPPQELLREAVGPVPRDLIATLRIRALEILRPLAQLEPVQPSRSA